MEPIEYPLYYASLYGLHQPGRLLLERGAEANMQGRDYANALQAAAIEVGGAFEKPEKSLSATVPSSLVLWAVLPSD